MQPRIISLTIYGNIKQIETFQAEETIEKQGQGCQKKWLCRRCDTAWDTSAEDNRIQSEFLIRSGGFRFEVFGRKPELAMFSAKYWRK